MRHIIVLGVILAASTVSAVADTPGRTGTLGGDNPDQPVALSNPDLLGLKSPVRVTTGESDTLLVTDFARGRVFVVSRSTLDVQSEFPVHGQPTGIVATGELIFVGNQETGRIDVHAADGRFLRQLQVPVGLPTDMAFDAEAGQLYVVSAQERVVKVLTLDGQLVRTIPGPGEEPLSSPTGIALHTPPHRSDLNGDGAVDRHDVDLGLTAAKQRDLTLDLNHDGRMDMLDVQTILTDVGETPRSLEIYISDFGNADPENTVPPGVRIYGHDGTHLRSLTGAFSRPQGLVVSDDQVFLVDSLLCKVLVLDAHTGALVRTLGEFGDETGQLWLPLDIFLDTESQDIFVTNSRLGRVEAFRNGGQGS